MDDEQEDVKRMTQFLNEQKSYQSNYQIEFEDFVNYKHDNSDQEYDDDLLEGNLDPISAEISSIYTGENEGLAFTEEEQNIIDSCPDAELKKLLILNRSKNLQLIKLHKKIQTFLKQCDEEIEEKRVLLENTELKQTNQQTYLWKLLAPYFKDKKFFPCPRNEDTKKKRLNNELSTYDLNPCRPWIPMEFSRLATAVKCNYNINRQNDVVSKISILKSKIQKEEGDNKHLMEEMLMLKEKLEKIKSDDQVPPLKSNEFINWYKVEEIFLKGKHTALECQSVWHILVHPQINTFDWTEEENRKLEIIAKKHSYQNWELIADELNTNRTGFITCLHYFSKLCDKFKKSKFTPEEDQQLLDAVDLYKIGNFIPWNKVVCHFNNRSRHQLYHRYTYFLSQNHVKRGKFSEAEDILLIILVNKFGKNFRICAEYMPHRSQVQLKSRYNSNLQRQIKKGTFSVEDDEIIYQYVQKHGEKSWTGLAKKLNRCNAQIRQRYKAIKRFLRENPDSSVADIPKRRHRFDEFSEGQHNFLNYMAEQYRDCNYIPTLKMIEDSLQAKLVTPTSVKVIQHKKGKTEIKPKTIDDMLTDFFTSVKIKPSPTITESILKEATENAEEMLKLLNAKLDIPKNLDCDSHLDNIDVEILERISKKVNTNFDKIEKLVPPNLSTLVGLKNLIIKHKVYKSQQKKIASTAKCESLLEESDEIFHQNLFSKRFNILFNWSAILSLEKPCQSDNKQDDATESTVIRTPQKTYKRTSNQKVPHIKKRKIDITELTQLSDHPQRKLIDKEIAEDIIRRNNINVITIEKITSPDGVVKPILKSNHLKSNVSINPETHIDHDTEEVVTNNDLRDVERLDVMLKTMKSEPNNDAYCSSEDESVKDDVQLLKQALSFEKVNLKFDSEGF